jgi:hypothetical protein
MCGTFSPLFPASRKGTTTSARRQDAASTLTRPGAFAPLRGIVLPKFTKSVLLSAGFLLFVHVLLRKPLFNSN